MPQSLLDIASKRMQNIDKNFVLTDCNQKLDDLIEMCKQSDLTNWNAFCNEITMRDNFRKNSIIDVIPEMQVHLQSFKKTLNNRKEKYVKVQRNQ